MNANELADKLQDFFIITEDELLEQAATMLREQQAEIESLKSNVVPVNISQEYVDKTQNNRHEPVAWMQTWANQKGEAYYTFNKEQIGINDIPLFTHPVKEPTWKQEDEVRLDDALEQAYGFRPHRELTDGEILEELLIPKSEWDSYKAHHCLKQIRAILRKAQEK